MKKATHAKIKLSKSDLVILMQVLNKSLAKTPIGHGNKKHLPRLIKKVDKKLLKLIENEKSTISTDVGQ